MAKRHPRHRERHQLAPPATRRRQLSVALTIVVGAIIVLSGTLLTATPQAAVTDTLLPDDVKFVLGLNSVRYRPLPADEQKLYGGLPVETIGQNLAAFMGLSGTATEAYAVSLRTDEDNPDGPQGWFPALGFRFDDQTASFNNGVFSSVVLWARYEAAKPGEETKWVPLFALGVTPIISPSPGPQETIQATPGPTGTPTPVPSATLPLHGPLE